MEKTDKIYVQVEKMVKKYGTQGPFKLDPDAVRVDNIVMGLALHKEKYGKAYCPCRPIEDSLKLGRENICPCTSHKEDIERDGYCDCVLFVSEEFAQKTKKDLDQAENPDLTST